MTNNPNVVNDRHLFMRDLEALLAHEQARGMAVQILNLVNRSYAQGYREALPENHAYLAMPDDVTVIMDGAGRVIGHVPPRTVVDGTVSGRFRTYVQSGHLHVWDEERRETIALFEIPENVAFNVHRADGTTRGETPDDQQLRQVAEEVRVRWAASRALPTPHYIVCLPHDYVAKLRARVEDLTDDHGVATGIKEALDAFIDQLDAWTEWDAVKGWR